MSSAALFSIIIPSLDPDERLLNVVEDCIRNGFNKIIVVNDGSQQKCQDIFNRIGEKDECIVLQHNQNRGKGAALKTAFRYIMDGTDRELHACITVDGDGQHTGRDIVACAKKSLEEPDKLILGSRCFTRKEAKRKNIPMRSWFGNWFTAKIFSLFCGLYLSDTQTGLRVIPVKYLNDFLGVDGDRFEYETNMLLTAKKNHIPVGEVKIETVYIDENRSSHFHPVHDSIKIYKQIIKFAASSLSSAVVDFIAFSLLTIVIDQNKRAINLLIATVIARVLSSLYNYIVNRKIVFSSVESVGKTLAKYYLIVILMMSASYFTMLFLTNVFDINSKIFTICLKALVDTILFGISYYFQKNWIFN